MSIYDEADRVIRFEKRLPDRGPGGRYGCTLVIEIMQSLRDNLSVQFSIEAEQWVFSHDDQATEISFKILHRSKWELNPFSSRAETWPAHVSSEWFYQKLAVAYSSASKDAANAASDLFFRLEVMPAIMRDGGWIKEVLPQTWKEIVDNKRLKDIYESQVLTEIGMNKSPANAAICEWIIVSREARVLAALAIQHPDLVLQSAMRCPVQYTPFVARICPQIGFREMENRVSHCGVAAVVVEFASLPGANWKDLEDKLYFFAPDGQTILEFFEAVPHASKDKALAYAMSDKVRFSDVICSVAKIPGIDLKKILQFLLDGRKFITFNQIVTDGSIEAHEVEEFVYSSSKCSFELVLGMARDVKGIDRSKADEWILKNADLPQMRSFVKSCPSDLIDAYLATEEVMDA